MGLAQGQAESRGPQSRAYVDCGWNRKTPAFHAEWLISANDPSGGSPHHTGNSFDPGGRNEGAILGRELQASELAAEPNAFQNTAGE